ncbi:MAG: MFS transporter [Candidatus Hydrogenedentes bacterium]|nr:MFS transporter [Candidatus Hydrogenedentota bacterium]
MSAHDDAAKTPEYDRRGFWALVITQAQGAFSDSCYKYLMIPLLAGIASSAEGGAASSQARVTDTTALASFIFALPFVIFPGLFGSLADRNSKKDVAVWTKYLEIAVMTLGSFGFFFHQPVLLWVALFLMASQSAMFGPPKYGLLPETLDETKLSWANGIIQATTMVMVIVGTYAGGALYDVLGPSNAYLAGLGLIGLAAAGTFTSHFIMKPPAANPEQVIRLNPWAGMGRDFRVIMSDRWLYMIAIGYSFFWFAGALIIQNILLFVTVDLGLGMTEVSVMSGVLSLGIGVGSFIAGYLSRGKVEFGFVPIGGTILGVLCLLLAWPGFAYSSVLLLMFGIGMGGGMFDVPLAAGLQHRSPQHIRGSIMATANMMTWVGILAAAPVFYVLSHIGVSSFGIFFFTGVSTLAVLAISCAMTPQMIVRAVLWILSTTFLRLELRGRQNIPERGGALLVTNNLSLIDALVITSAVDRPIRFVLSDGVNQIDWMRRMAKLMRIIPIASQGSPRDLAQTMHAASVALQHGELVCVFADGRIAPDSPVAATRKGFERLMHQTNAPVIPVYLDRTWGTLFEGTPTTIKWKIPRTIPFPMLISFGDPMPVESSLNEVRTTIQHLGTEAYMDRRLDVPLLHRAFVRTVHRHPFSICVGDSRTPRMSYLMTYIGSIALARRIKMAVGPEEMTGILLPQSVGAVLVNIALQIMGKVPVNLNYTASNESIASAARQCGIRHVLTAREFLERVPVEVPGETIFLDDIRKQMGSKDRIIAALMALFLPVRVVEWMLGSPRGRSENDLATIIFSSGSEGEPKGVMLTQRNVLTNLETTAQVFPHNVGDGMMGILPFFHSFGFMGTLWMPLWRGFFTVYHPNPLEPKIIGQLVYKYRPRFLVATPTFLQGFIRRCLPEELASLTYVVTGAEKLPTRIREAFHSKFGVEPLEGYGTTECAPAVSINVPNFQAPGFYWEGTRHGTIGLPLPGLSVKITDPDTGELMPLGQSGVLWVKGPNIMKGYLGQPEKTAHVLVDGWYNTGDMAAIDEDGKITITDRLARFSKIAGEMVPHNKVEETLHRLLEINDQTFAVTSVPDEQKGERLVVLHTLMDGELEVLVERLKTCDLPNLWRPKATSFYRIAQIPVLGTGKMDLKRIKSLAKELDVGE